MSAQGPILVGVRGVVEGEEYPLKYGASVVIGRSRSCDVSLRDCKRWREAEEAGARPEEGSKTVSRKHVKVTFHDAGSIEVEDLSSNGTFVDGKRIDRMVITDVKETRHEIVLGAGEAFRLEWR
jgi:pSer/pThr/pTyr-binding forkhead associated (FHA) protein